MLKIKFKEIYKLYQNNKINKSKICKVCKTDIICDLCKRFGKVDGMKWMIQSKKYLSE